jgi:hypothetical protein
LPQEVEPQMHASENLACLGIFMVTMTDRSRGMQEKRGDFSLRKAACCIRLADMVLQNKADDPPPMCGEIFHDTRSALHRGIDERKRNRPANLR